VPSAKFLPSNVSKKLSSGSEGVRKRSPSAASADDSPNESDTETLDVTLDVDDDDATVEREVDSDKGSVSFKTFIF
jgi:hypothetical protein